MIVFSFLVEKWIFKEEEKENLILLLSLGFINKYYIALIVTTSTAAAALTACTWRWVDSILLLLLLFAIWIIRYSPFKVVIIADSLCCPRGHLLTLLSLSYSENRIHFITGCIKVGERSLFRAWQMDTIWWGALPSIYQVSKKKVPGSFFFAWSSWLVIIIVFITCCSHKVYINFIYTLFHNHCLLLI